MKFSGEVPKFVRVTACGELVDPTPTVPKSKLLGDSVTKVPVPVRFKTCEPEPSLSETVTVPYLTPAVVGVNVTEMVQLEPALRLFPQLLLWL